MSLEQEFQIDTISVHDLGTAIVNSAQEEKSSTNPLALDNFVKDLDSVVPELPHILQSSLKLFDTNFSKGYGDVLDHRADIGRILLGTATEAEQREVQTVNWFMDNQPQTLIP